MSWRAIRERFASSIRWFFAEIGSLRGTESSACIALFRVLYCAGVAIEVLRAQGHRDSSFNRPTYDPIDLIASFGVEPMPLEFFEQVRWLLVGCLTLAVLGVFTRTALWLALLSFLAYEGTYLGFTKPIDSQYVYHMSNLTVFALLVLAIAPDVGRHTLWSLLRGAKDAVPVARWPRRVVVGAIAIGYFGAGYCKMVESPLWVDGYTLQGYMLDRAIRHEIDIALWLASHYGLCVFLSVATILLELSWILVIRYPRLAWTHVPSALLLHVSILITMKIDFFQFFALNYLVFLDWEWLARRYAAIRGRLRPLLPTQPYFKPSPLAPALLLFLFGCVVFRVESWPLTDFRVYSKRRHPDRVGVLVLKKTNSAGESYLVNDTQMLKFRRAVGFATSTQILEAMKVKDAEERAERLNELQLAIYRNVGRFDPRYFRRQRTLQLYLVSPVWDPDRERFRVREQFVMPLPPPL